VSLVHIPQHWGVQVRASEYASEASVEHHVLVPWIIVLTTEGVNLSEQRAGKILPLVLAGSHEVRALHAAFLGWSAAVMGNGSTVFDRLNIQPRLLERRNGTLATGAWSINEHIHIFHTKLECLFCCLLRGTLTSKGSTLATSLEATRPGAGPTKGIPLGVGYGHNRVIERRFDMGYSHRHVTTNSSFLSLCHWQSLLAVDLALARLRLFLTQVFDALFTSHGFLGALACTGIGSCSLTADWQAMSVP
jgi:hypothetical protein